MIITLYSDPHIGLQRQAHTTAMSAARWRKKLFETSDEILNTAGRVSICLGDLFDSHSNDEQSISLGYALASRTNVILAGNHDVDNRRDKLSSLQLISEIFDDMGVDSLDTRILSTTYGERNSYQTDYDGTIFVFVPHVANRDLFELSLQYAEKQADRYNGTPKSRILCLHCNYDLPEGFSKADTTLNLTQERAYKLLATFHRILIGHEHTPRQDSQTDRIQLLGSVFPTSFGDISDKFYWEYDTETGTLTPHLCWFAEEGFYHGPASLAIPGFEFYDLDDDLTPGATAKLITSLYEAERTLAVRLRRKETQAKSETSAEVSEFSTLPDLIQEELGKSSPKLLSLFREYLQNVREN